MSLDSWLQIDEQRVSRGRIIPYRVRFDLDSRNLTEIYRVYTDNSKIQISSNKLTNLRYYALLASQNIQESPLVFATNYLQNNQKVTIVQSIISLDGKVSQQIRQDVWDSSQTREKILPLHHWLIWQMLRQLSFKIKNYSFLIALALALLVTILLIPTIQVLLDKTILLKLLAIGLMFSLLTYSMQYLLIHQFKAWILQQLLFGFLSYPVNKRKIGLKILSLLG